MKDFLVMVAPDEDGDFANLRYAMPGAAEFLHPVALESADRNRNRYDKYVEGWMCSERELPACVDMMTRNFPGRDIQVLKLAAIHVRPPGELQTKTVSKNGILPA